MIKNTVKHEVKGMVVKAAIFIVMAAIGGCAGMKTDDAVEEASQNKEGSSEPAAAVDFLTEVKPLLENYCLSCHNTGLLLGDLNLETRALAFASEGGTFIIPKHPESSKFYQVLKLEKSYKQAMPPAKHRMSEKEGRIIYQWIKQGADWPKDSRGTLRPVVDRSAVAMR